MRRFAMLTAIALLAGLPAAAEDRAVAVIEREYDKFGTAAAPDADALFGTLRASGMRVASGTDLGARDVRVALDDLSRPDPQPGARIVVLTGKFVNSASDTWLLARDAATPTLATADLNGIALSAVVDLMRDGGNRSVLLLGDASGGVQPEARLQDGIGRIGAGGAVNVITGTPQAVAAAAASLSRPGTTVAAVLRNDPALRLVQGSGGDVAPLPVRPVVADPAAPGAPVVADPAATPAAPVVVVERPAEPPRPERRVLEGEAEAWVLAAARHSVASYQEFLRGFPEGRYAEVARMRLTQLGGQAPQPSAAPTTPVAPVVRPPEPSPQSAQLAEIALNLSRSERVQVQQHLTGLGYDTRGIDGIFGSGTRAALTRWQRENGLPATGYLDAAAIARLKAQAEARGRQGAAGPRPGTAAAQRDAAWRQAVKANSIAGYNSFVEKYPGTPAAAEARRRMRWLTANRAAAEGERKLGLTQATRKLIEERLQQSGLKVGEVDGRFDAATRQAIRAYQKTRDLQATGFVNEHTATRLLSEALVGR